MNEIMPPPTNPNMNEDRPAAEVVAEFFGFPLAYHDTSDGRFYAVQDWIAGVAKTDNSRRFWNDVKRRAKKSGIELYAQCVQLPYKARNGRTYQVDHAPAQTLYTIAQRMDANTGIRDAVMSYLSKAGVIVDEIRRDPEGAAEALNDIATNREYRKMLEEGFTHEEAVQWLDIREKQKQHRKVITGTWKSRGARPPDFAILTNEAHAVAVGVTATEHKRLLDIRDTPRNYISAAENATIQITEYTAALLHNSRNSYGYDELSEDIEDVRPIIDAARPEIDRVFSKKPRRLRGAAGVAVLQPVTDLSQPPEPAVETPVWLTIHFERSDDPARDRRRLRLLYGILTSYPGTDRFRFIVETSSVGQQYELDFPDHTTGYCPELIAELSTFIDAARIDIS